MHITFLGVGDTTTPELGYTSAVVVDGSAHLLIDYSLTSHQRLASVGLSTVTLQNLYISHLHNDHIDGIGELARELRQRGRKVNLYIPQPIYGEALSKFETLAGFNIAEVFVFYAVGTSFQVGSMLFYLKEMRHLPKYPCWGLYLPGSFFYSADGHIDEAYLTSVAPHVHYIFHDVALRVDKKNPAHATLGEFLTPSLSSVCSKLVVMHYNQQGLSDASVVSALNTNGIYVARPLQTFNL